MTDRQFRSELLDASYEAVKLELENTEKDLKLLEQRVKKLHAALAAIAEILPNQDEARGDQSPVNDKEPQGDNRHPRRPSDPVTEPVRASA